MRDVVVVGGGVAGLCAAIQLTRAGATVALFEAHAIGAGASGNCSGQLLLGVVEAPHRVMASLGEARTRELFALTEQSTAWLGERGLLLRTGQVSVATDEREAKELALSHQVLEAMGMSATLHASDEASFGLAGPALELETAGRVHPAQALAALTEEARSVGVLVFEDAPVRRIDEGLEGLTIHGGDQRIGAEVVVWATGIGTRTLEPALADLLVAVREQGLSLTGLPSSAPRGGRSGHGYTWFERWDDEAWVGGCRWATPHLEVGEIDPVVEPRVRARIEAAAARLGWVDSGSVARSWAWIDAHTRDGLPLIGPVPGSNRLLACTGFCGNDWGLGPAAAGLVAEGLMGERAEATRLFAPSRFL